MPGRSPANGRSHTELPIVGTEAPILQDGGRHCRAGTPMTDLLQEPRWAEALIQSLPDGIIIIDGQGAVLSFNHAAERITGWSAQEALGASIDSVVCQARGRGPLLERL